MSEVKVSVIIADEGQSCSKCADAFYSDVCDYVWPLHNNVASLLVKLCNILSIYYEKFIVKLSY